MASGHASRIETWPSRGRSHSSDLGQWRRSQSACVGGTMRSSPPWTSRTGASIRVTSNPHGATKATSSSIRPSGGAGADGVVAERGPRSRQGGPVGRREAVLVELLRRGVSGARLAAVDGRPQPAGSDHPGEPVDVRGDRRQARQANGARHPLAQQGRAGERVRAPARRAHDREPPHPECVGELRHIGRRRCHVTSRARARTAVARPAVGQQPDAALRGRRHQRHERSAGLRRAVVPDDRDRGVVSGGRVVHPQDAAVGEPYVALGRHGTTYS